VIKFPPLTDKEKTIIKDSREQIANGIYPLGRVANYIQILFIREHLEKNSLEKQKKLLELKKRL